MTCLTPTSCLTSLHSQAESMCETLGLRLCTKGELDSGIFCGTGCGFDTALTWTGNLGQPCGTLCGDGLVGWPKERCDDGNVEPFDGCNSTCHPDRGRCAEQV